MTEAEWLELIHEAVSVGLPDISWRVEQVEAQQALLSLAVEHLSYLVMAGLALIVLIWCLRLVWRW